MVDACSFFFFFFLSLADMLMPLMLLAFAEQICPGGICG